MDFSQEIPGVGHLQAANHQGREGARSKRLRPRAFVILRVLVFQGLVGWKVKLPPYRNHRDWNKKARNEVNSNERNLLESNRDLPEMRREQRGQFSLLRHVRGSIGASDAGKCVQG